MLASAPSRHKGCPGVYFASCEVGTARRWHHAHLTKQEASALDPLINGDIRPGEQHDARPGVRDIVGVALAIESLLLSQRCGHVDLTGACHRGAVKPDQVQRQKSGHSALLFVRHTNMSLCALIDARFLLCEDHGSTVESARKCCSRQAEALTRLGLLCSCPGVGLCPKHYTRVQSLCKRLVFPICHRSSTHRGHGAAVWTVAPLKSFPQASAGGVND